VLNETVDVRDVSVVTDLRYPLIHTHENV
jgi:hypothetical protein